MATVLDDRRNWTALPGQCQCDGASTAVTVTALGVEGCTIEAEEVWPAAYDFVHLDIAGTLAMNGKVVRVSGRRAEVRFFGQVHPAAIAKLIGSIIR